MSRAQPGGKPRTVANGPAPGACPRLFVVHAPADAWFVEGFLLEALRLPEGEVLVSSKLEPGAVIVNEIERGALSPVTVVVVSPAFLASPWAQFGNQLAMHQSIEAATDGSATLVPAILADCELPLLSRFRVPLDFRNQDREHWEVEAERLRRKLAAPVPTVAPVPCPYPGIRPFTTEDAARFHGRDKEVKDNSSSVATTFPRDRRYLSAAILHRRHPIWSRPEIATVSIDRTIGVWDAGTGQPVTPPLAHQGEVNDCGTRARGNRWRCRSRTRLAFGRWRGAQTDGGWRP